MCVFRCEYDDCNLIAEKVGDERLFDAQPRWLILDRRGCQNPLAFAPLLYRSFK